MEERKVAARTGFAISRLLPAASDGMGRQTNESSSARKRHSPDTMVMQRCQRGLDTMLISKKSLILIGPKRAGFVLADVTRRQRLEEVGHSKPN